MEEEAPHACKPDANGEPSKPVRDDEELSKRLWRLLLHAKRRQAQLMSLLIPVPRVADKCKVSIVSTNSAGIHDSTETVGWFLGLQAGLPT